MTARPGTYARIYGVVARIPRGRVATYGQIARLSGLPGQARMVGYALAALEEGSKVPWHRVVNGEGRISARRSGGGAEAFQKARLLSEGVAFDGAGRIRLARHRWRPRLAPVPPKRRESKARRTP